MDKFALKIHTPVIPAIPGILYILLLLLHLLRHYTSDNNKMKFERHLSLSLGYSDTFAYENRSLKRNK